MKPRSLRGRSAEEVKGWVTWYLGKLGAMSSISVDEVLRAAAQENGKGAKVTKTRVRKVLKRLLPRDVQAESSTERRSA